MVYAIYASRERVRRVGMGRGGMGREGGKDE